MTLLVAQELQTDNHGTASIHFSMSMSPPPKCNFGGDTTFTHENATILCPGRAFTSKSVPGLTLVRVKKKSLTSIGIGQQYFSGRSELMRDMPPQLSAEVSEKAVTSLNPKSTGKRLISYDCGAIATPSKY